MHWFRSSALAIAAVSLRAAGQVPPGELRDIAPAVEMPADPTWPLYLTISVCVVLIGAAILFVVRRRRPKPVIVPVPPQRVALDALRELEDGRHEPRVFYIRLMEILRAYIAERFGVHEPDATSSELMTELFRAAEIASEHQHLLRVIVRESDLVKFAGCLSTVDAQVQCLAACRRFVRETAVEQEVVSHAL